MFGFKVMHCYQFFVYFARFGGLKSGFFYFTLIANAFKQFNWFEFILVGSLNFWL